MLIENGKFIVRFRIIITANWYAWRHLLSVSASWFLPAAFASAVSLLRAHKLRLAIKV